MTAPVLVLVGPPGAGKTTVGARVAERLDVEFVDTDRRLAEQAGAPAGEMLIELGEQEFRRREAAVVSAALAGSGVVALGSGAIEAARDRLVACVESGSRVVFLDVSLAAAAPRLGLNVPRAVALGNARAQLAAMAAERRPQYEEVASRTIDTSEMSPDEVVDALLTDT